MDVEERRKLDAVVRQRQQERRAKVVSTLAPGFTFCPEGRSGFIYYYDRPGDRLLEVYVEMSGVPQYDLLVSRSGLDTWVHPRVSPLTRDERSDIRSQFAAWLGQQDFKTDYE